MCMREGDERRYVPLAHIKKHWRSFAAFGVEMDGVRVGYDAILRKRGYPPIFKQIVHREYAPPGGWPDATTYYALR